MNDTHKTTFLAVADDLIPSHGKMPAFSECCSYEDALAALDFRSDLKEAFERGVSIDTAGNVTAAVDKLVADDSEAFDAVSSVALCTYFMNPAVREMIGYPGQESVGYDSKATQSYLLDGSLAKVIARGPIYKPTPGLD
jgi:hypothetical protein